VLKVSKDCLVSGNLSSPPFRARLAVFRPYDLLFNYNSLFEHLRCNLPLRRRISGRSLSVRNGGFPFWLPVRRQTQERMIVTKT